MVKKDPDANSHALQELILNPEKLDILLHTAAIITMLKAKARSLLNGEPKLSHADVVIYEKCIETADNAITHARCVVHLLKARDMLHSVNDNKNLWPKPTNDGMDFLAQLNKWISPFFKNESKTIENTMNWSQLEQKSAIEDNHKSIFKTKNKFKLNIIKDRPEKGYNKLTSNLFAKYSKKDVNITKKYQPIDNSGFLVHSIKSKTNHHNYTVAKSSRSALKKRREINFLDKASKFKNIEKLKRLYEFYKMYNHCQSFMKKMGESNTEFLNEIGSRHKFEVERTNDLESVLVHELENQLKDFTFENFPILSPKLFSLFPEETTADDKKFRPSLLSPTMFSLHEEGVFSLPTIFKLLLRDEDEMLGWLDLFMDISGASKTLDKLDSQIKPKINDLRNHLYPTVLKLEALERRWDILKKSFNQKQKNSFHNFGYVVLNHNQKMFLHGNTNFVEKNENIPRNKRDLINTNTNEDSLESDIYKIASLPDHFPLSNKTSSYLFDKDNATLINTTEELLGNATALNTDIGVLRPFIYGNKLRQAPALNNVVLSPQAFGTTILSPKFLTSSTLSPQAFMVNVLSPTAMVAIILSPTAFTASILSPTSMFTDVLAPKFFHANILTPRSLAALIMSPRTMLFNVLSPRLLEFRVLSPVTFYIGVLTPAIVVPRVLSPNSFTFTVLSPVILSPTVLSKGNFSVQVLSPSFLSGSLDPGADKKNSTMPKLLSI